MRRAGRCWLAGTCADMGDSRALPARRDRGEVGRRMTRTIADVIGRELGTFADLPLPSGDGWLRTDCVFCGKPRAALNWQAGWYECAAESAGTRCPPATSFPKSGVPRVF